MFKYKLYEMHMGFMLLLRGISGSVLGMRIPAGRQQRTPWPSLLSAPATRDFGRRQYLKTLNELEVTKAQRASKASSLQGSSSGGNCCQESAVEPEKPTDLGAAMNLRVSCYSSTLLVSHYTSRVCDCREWLSIDQ